ncbi:MAG: GSCFA domain-containing protein [Saprospiraceae bacterium]|nr:GSCFA domain-containing protein [Saprospiraceae bacterium]
MNETASTFRSYISKMDRLIVTFGSAITYTHTLTSQLVANCHKIPASQFIRKILSPDEMVNASQQWIEDFHRARPGYRYCLHSVRSDILKKDSLTTC